MLMVHPTQHCDPPLHRLGPAFFGLASSILLIGGGALPSGCWKKCLPLIPACRLLGLGRMPCKPGLILYFGGWILPALAFGTNPFGPPGIIDPRRAKGLGNDPPSFLGRGNWPGILEDENILRGMGPPGPLGLTCGNPPGILTPPLGLLTGSLPGTSGLLALPGRIGNPPSRLPGGTGNPPSSLPGGTGNPPSP